MKAIAIIAGTMAVLNIAQAQWRDMKVIGSASGQFFVSAPSLSLSPHSIELATDPKMVTLEPPLVAVSCDRIKQELLRELDTPDQWQGKIFVVLHPARTADDPAAVAPEHLGGNWDCGVQLPDVMDRDRFVEAIVRACLLEMANRNAGNRSTEIPEWLAQGLTRQLIGSSATELILSAPLTKVNGFNVSRITLDFSDDPRTVGGLTRHFNPMAGASQILRTNAALSFEELSWPTEEQLSDAGADVFSSSAQLFVARLLRLKNGPACLRKMLAEMPGYLNWQLAFLDAFHDSFQEPLDVEKWWALQLADFNRRDLLHLLTPDESWRQLDALFQFPIEVKIGDTPPMRTDITFQTIIRGWSRPRQLAILKKKLWELDLLRLRISPELIPLVDGYREALQNYYQQQNDSLRNLADVKSDKVVTATVQRLDALDVQRAKMRPQPPMPVAAATGAPPTAP